MSVEVDDLFAGDHQAPPDPRPRIRSLGTASLLGHLGASTLGVLALVVFTGSLFFPPPAEWAVGLRLGVLVTFALSFLSAPACVLGVYAWLRAGEEAARSREGALPAEWSGSLDRLRRFLGVWLLFGVLSMGLQSTALGWWYYLVLRASGEAGAGP